jgi:hypothetical protein
MNVADSSLPICASSDAENMRQIFLSRRLWRITSILQVRFGAAFSVAQAGSLRCDRTARLARCDNEGDRDFPPVLVSLTKGQQNQSLMVNALLSVVVYFV